MPNIKDYKLNTTVFVSGAVVMILELAGSRAIAPYLGGSLYTWTSLIGVILASLSLGYWWGGKLSDISPSNINLSYILLFSAITVFLTNIIKDPMLASITALGLDLRIGATLAGLLLFSVPSVCLGMVSPYAARLKLTQIYNSGTTVGKLYALSTIGSIAGTFLAGFVLLSFFGTTNIIYILSVTLLLLAALNGNYTKTLVVFVVFCIVYLLSSTTRAFVLEKDTAYQHIRVLDVPEQSSGRIKRYLFLNDQNSSGIYLDTKAPFFEYIKFWNVIEHFVPNFKDTLALGGAGFTYPFYFVNKYPESNITVVEIDPELYSIAKQYFEFEDNPRLKVVSEDGRTYLNKDITKKYDVIFGDAFNAQRSVPFQLTTVEALSKIYDSLNDDGIYIMNIISSLDGDGSGFFKSEYKTLSAVFPQVYVFPIYTDNPYVDQNIALIAFKSKDVPSFESDNPLLDDLLKKLYKATVDTSYSLILTDDFAPVEKFSINTYE